MFENPRRGRQARNFTTNVTKILDLKSSSEQRLSVKRDQFETLSIQNKRGRIFRPSRFRGRTRLLLSFAISRFFSKTLCGRGRHTLIILRHFMVLREPSTAGEPDPVYTGKHFTRFWRLPYILRSQALCLLYLFHPPEAGNGGKRVGRRREKCFLLSVINVSIGSKDN